MKTILKCLACMLLAPNLLIAQSNSSSEKEPKPNVDFSFPSWTVDKDSIRPVKHGALTSIRIRNINTLVYDVSIKGEQVILSTPSSTEFNTLFRIKDPGEVAAKANEGLKEGKEANEVMKQTEDGAEVKTNATLQPIMTKLVEICKNYVEAADKVASIKSRRAELTILAKFPWPDYEALKAKLPHPLSYSDMTDAIRAFQKTYVEAEAKYEEAEEAAKDPAVKKKIADALKLFEEGYNKINESDLLKLADDVLALQLALASDFLRTVWGPPVQADDCDFIRYSIVAEGLKDGSRFIPAASFQPIFVDIPVIGGWKADFSVGLNFSFGNGSRDGKYRFEPPVNDQRKLVKADNHNFVRPGIASMLHAYPRTGRGYALGFLLGIGAGFKEENTLSTSYYLGGSLILGKSQRIIVNSGLGMIAVDRLKGDFKEGNSYAVDPEKLPELTEKALRPTFFIGISYNITNRTVRK